MLEISAQLAVLQVTRETAFNSRPTAPALSDRTPIAHGPRVVAARQRLSLLLRHLADVIQPVGTGMHSPLPATR